MYGNKLINRLIVASVIILVLVLFFTVLLRGFRNRNSPEAQITPVPTKFFESRRSFKPQSAEEKQKEFQEVIRQSRSGLLPNQATNLNRLKEKMPFTSDDFDISYSEKLDAFIIQKKTAQADARLREFLEQNGVFDIYLGGSGTFIVSNEPIGTTETQAETDIKEDIEHGSVDETVSPTPPSSQEKDIQLLVELVRTLRNFNERPPSSEEVTPTPETPPPSSGNVTCPSNLGSPNHLGYYQMPTSPNNDYVISSCPARRYGHRDLVRVLNTVAVAWKTKFPGSLVRIGDLNASGHLSHNGGIAVDIFTTDRSAADTRGSRERSIELGKLFVNTNLIKNIWYCDSAVNSAVLAYARANNLSLVQMKCISGHHNHFHVDIKIPKGPYHTPSC